jgi:type IV secretory pathway VirB4 component
MRGLRLPAHESTTAQLGAAFPFASEGALPAPGALVGRDLLGGAFAFDPFELYARGALTSPNLIVFGQIGRGKSAFVKSWLWRQAAFGRRCFVIDPKGEYGPLATALGAAPIALRPGGPVRVNPLDAAGAGSDPLDEDASRRRLSLLGALATACLGRRLAPAEHAALELALAEATRRSSGARRRERRQPTLPDVVGALLSPTVEAARRIGATQAVLRADGREVGLELRRLVTGDLRGMFDGATTQGLDPAGRVVVLDLSALYHSPALGAVMTCAAAWLQAGLLADPGARTILVVDEAWAILADRGVGRWLQSAWKLSRALGVANVAVLHRVSDLRSAGAAGSEESRLAEGLLSDSETLVLYGQPSAELSAARELLGLSETEEVLLAGLRRGVALWKVAGRSFLVEHTLAPAERRLVDTDARMAAKPRGFPASGANLPGTEG